MQFKFRDDVVLGGGLRFISKQAIEYYASVVDIQKRYSELLSSGHINEDPVSELLALYLTYLKEAMKTTGHTTSTLTKFEKCFDSALSQLQVPRDWRTNYGLQAATKVFRNFSIHWLSSAAEKNKKLQPIFQ